MLRGQRIRRDGLPDRLDARGGAVTGSSTYTFSLIVAAFIFGLALGAFLLSRAGALIDRAPWLFGALQIAIGAAAALLLPVLGELPIHAYDLIGRNKDSFARLMAVELLMLFAIVAVPTMMMGALFPLSARMLASGGAGRAVGAAYGANTAGSIAGAFLAGFALLPAFGVRGTLLFASGINVAFGCLALALATPVRAARVGAAALLLAAAWPLGARLPAWNQTVLASEPYLLKASFKERLAPEREGKAWSTRIVFFRDDPDVTVAVEQIGDGCVLRLNGKADASTFVDMPTQRLLGHLPMLLHGHARTACVIGMGSGASAGAVSVYPGLERVDVVEIARSVIEAAHHFDEVNHQILASPRARFLLADGRTHLRFTPETYDVIVSEPSNPWIAGIGKLFTVEMFRECRARLSPGGVMAAWLQSYRVSREAVAVVLRSFERVFPNVTVWTCSPGDLLLVGVNGDATLDLDRVRALIADPAIASDMSALRIEEPADLVPHLLMGSEDVRRFTAGGSRVNTDDNGWLELAAPRTLHLREDVLRAADCFAERRPLPSELPFAVTGADGERSVLKEKLGGILEAERSSLLAQDALDAGDLGTAEEAARRALAKNPHDLPAALALGDVLISRTRTLVDASRFEEAAPLLTDLSRVLPNDPQLPYDASTTFIHLKRPADALPFLDRLKRAYPADLAVRGNRALALCEVGRFADAREDAAEIVAQRPGDPRGSFLLARALVGEGKPREALALLDPILAKDPGAVEPRYLRAQAARALGDVESAVRELEAIQDKKPEARAEAVRILNSEAERLARIGQEGAAASARERAARLESQGPGI
ncbi:MAG: fused MFS/spermidine synthase [Acidobacteriota bacterium]